MYTVNKTSVQYIHIQCSPIENINTHSYTETLLLISVCECVCMCVCECVHFTLQLSLTRYLTCSAPLSPSHCTSNGLQWHYFFITTAKRHTHYLLFLLGTCLCVCVCTHVCVCVCVCVCVLCVCECVPHESSKTFQKYSLSLST